MKTPQTGLDAFAASRDLSDLQARLLEAEETLDAIRNGEVDAVVVGGPSGQQVYTLENADRPYRVLIEQMHEGAVTMSADGTVLYCNERFADIARLPREQIVGESFKRFVDGDDAALLDRMLATNLEDGSSEEMLLRCADGAEVPVNFSVIELQVGTEAPPVICGVVTDLTHNRRRSHELAAANLQLAGEIEERKRVESSLELALDAAGMGSWDLDLATGSLHRSPRHDQIFGHDTPVLEWRLATTLDHFQEEDRPRVTSAFAEALSKGHVEFEARIRRAGDGASRWLQFKGQAYYQGTDATRIAGIVADVTDRRAVEEQLRQAQKMEAVGQLTGGIAHDFNNLLQVVGGQLQLLRKAVAGQPAAQNHIHNAMEGVARGARLAAQLLAFGRRQPLAPRVVNIGRFLRQIEDLLRRAVGDGVEIETLVMANLWNTLVDPANLENALLNLAINARDAMDAHGRILIQLRNVELDATSVRELPDASAGQYVLIGITDTGSGIPADILEKVFEPFFTTKAEGKGTGLGLSMVYGFVRQSGGHVRIHSEPGHGTTINLLLPRSLQEEDALVDTDQGTATGGTETILVAEDDAAVRETVVSMLRDLGYRVLTARDGQGALSIIDSGVPIDLLFTDVVMPGAIKSTELARFAKERCPGIAILFTSGYAADAIVHKGRLDADTELLSKPYSREALAGKLRSMLGSTAPSPAAPRRSLRVVVCEDNDIIRTNTVEMLEELGHSAVGAGDARSALQALSGGEIDILLTDIGLPDMPGTELARQARQRSADLPVIFATGYGQEVGIADGSPVAMLLKPFTIESLQDALGAVARTH